MDLCLRAYVAQIADFDILAQRCGRHAIDGDEPAIARKGASAGIENDGEK